MAATLLLSFDSSGSVYHLSGTGCAPQTFTAQVHRSLSSGVYQGDLFAGSESSPVVIKFARGSNKQKLRKEADVYLNELRAFQGSLVPKFLGFFVGSDGLDPNGMACIVMECCRLKQQASVDFGNRVVEALAMLHQAGIAHNRLSSSHILDTVAGVRIVSWAYATRHNCTAFVPMAHANHLGSCSELSGIYKKYSLSGGQYSMPPALSTKSSSQPPSYRTTVTKQGT